MIQMGSYGFKWYQTDTNGSIWGQNGPNSDQIGQHLVKMVESTVWKFKDFHTTTQILREIIFGVSGCPEF